MYRSFVMSIFIFMESQISDLCNHVFKRTNQNFNYKDLSGTGVSRSVKYLDKALRIKFLSDINLEIEFNIARIIRNSIAHSQGLILEKDQKTQIQLYIDKNSNMLSFDEGRVIIKYDYLKKLMALNEKICKEISNNWKQKFDID